MSLVKMPKAFLYFWIAEVQCLTAVRAPWVHDLSPIFLSDCIVCQCSKLRVHPAPCVHVLAAGCRDFSTCAHGVCMLFPYISIPLYQEEHMDELPGA